MEMILTFALWFILIMLGVHVGYALIMASLFFFTASGGWNLVPFAVSTARPCWRFPSLFWPAI